MGLSRIASGVAAWSLAAAASSTAVSAVACPDERAGSQSERQSRAAIQETLAAWALAIVDSDLEGLASLVTEDAEFWSHGAAPLVGRQALVDAFEPFLNEFTMQQDFQCHELILSDEWALLRGMEINHLTPRAGGESVVHRQRAFSVLRRQPDGRWLFARGMTNLPTEN